MEHPLGFRDCEEDGENNSPGKQERGWGSYSKVKDLNEKISIKPWKQRTVSKEIQQEKSQV